jgi:hypothetical protein
MEIAIERITVLLGFLTLTSALAVVASCRTIPALFKKIAKKDLLTNEGYQSFYFLHGFFWQAFFLLLAVHLVLGLTHLSMLTMGAEEIRTHLTILGFGALTALSYGGMLASCRITHDFFTKSFEPKSLKDRVYRVFYGLHDYYWLIVLTLVVTHFIFAHADAGWWPVKEQ